MKKDKTSELELELELEKPSTAENKIKNTQRLTYIACAAMLVYLTCTTTPLSNITQLPSTVTAEAATTSIASTQTQTQEPSIYSLSDNEKIVLITVWDYADFDGDIIRIQTSKISLDVTISKTPVNLEIPYQEGENINFIGIRDGVGGITASVEIMNRPLPLPVIAVGQTISLPLL